jgi:hypothetical protein
VSLTRATDRSRGVLYAVVSLSLIADLDGLEMTPHSTPRPQRNHERGGAASPQAAAARGRTSVGTHLVTDSPEVYVRSLSGLTRRASSQRPTSQKELATSRTSPNTNAPFGKRAAPAPANA